MNNISQLDELARLRADLARFTGDGLLDCHAICDQRDAAVAERDQLRAEAERSKEQQTDDAKSANETIEFLKSRAARAEADAKRERITWEAVDQCANNLAKSLEEAEAELAEARKDTQVTLNKLGDTLRELATERALTAKMLARFVWLNSQASGYGTEDSHEGNTWRFDGAYAALEDLADAEIDAAMKEDRE